MYTLVDSSRETKTFYTYDLVVAGSADRDDKENLDNNRWNKNICKYNIQSKDIRDIEEENDCQFNTILMDIEGGELPFLLQYKDYIKENITKVIVELHGRLYRRRGYSFGKPTMVNLYCALTTKSVFSVM